MYYKTGSFPPTSMKAIYTYSCIKCDETGKGLPKCLQRFEIIK